MKKLLILIILCTVFIAAQNKSLPDTGQNQPAFVDTNKNIAGDSVNVSAILQEQIIAAQNKKNNPPAAHVKKEIRAEEQWNSSSENELIPAGLKFKLALILIVSLGAAYFVINKRKKAGKLLWGKEAVKKELKENINSLRDEKPKRSANKELTVIRTRLKENAAYLKPADDEIARAAKELKIAKGELYLAAILKSHELTKVGNKKSVMEF